MTTVKSSGQSTPPVATRKAPGVKSQEKTTSTNNFVQKPVILNPSREAPQPPKDGPNVQLDLFDE